MVEENESQIEITNQIDRVVEKTMKEKYGLEKKFSKEIDDFKDHVKVKIEKVKKNKK